MSYLDNGLRSLALQRFPVTGDVNPLQAWEAADEYLPQQLGDAGIHGPVLILSDAFGALGCALAEHRPYSIGDPYIGELTTRKNLRLNEIDESSMKFLDSTADYPQQPGMVLIKVPKTLALLEQQLRALCKVVTPDTRTIAGTKARDIHTPTPELFEEVLGLTTTALTWRKACLIGYTFNGPSLADAPQTVNWELGGTGWTVHNHVNVLSCIGLDISTRFFIQYPPENPEGEIVDLDCGDGVIGLTLLGESLRAKMMSVDELPMTVASSHLNVKASVPEALDHYEFIVNNTLSSVEPFCFNAMSCNPPFHQQHALTDDVAQEMFHHTRHCLKVDDGLYTTANRYLSHFHKLKKIFGDCTTIATNNKSVVLKAVRLGRRRWGWQLPAGQGVSALFGARPAYYPQVR